MVTRALAAAMALGLASTASAGAGNGIRLGGSEGRLHPFLDLEARYDSNVLFEPDGEALGDVILHFRPGLTLDVPGDLTALRLRAALDWAQYLGVDGDTKDLSKLYGEASLGFGLNRRGEVSLEIDDAFRRSNATTALSLGSAVVSNLNTLRVAVPWRPGGGAMVVTVAGDWRLETFEPYFDGSVCDPANPLPECDTAFYDDLGYNEVGGSAELRWKFLPRTAALVKAEYFSRLPNEPDVSAEVSGLRTLAGVTGLVTARVAGTLEAGYGQTTGDADVSTWLANAEIEYLASETTRARLGYVHDIGVDPGTAFSVFQANRVYLEGEALLASRYTAKLLGQLEQRSYESGVDTSTLLYRVEPSVAADVTRWLAVSLAYAYTNRSSDLPSTADDIRGFDYSKNELWLRFTLTY